MSISLNPEFRAELERWVNENVILVWDDYTKQPYGIMSTWIEDPD